jgi:hypothetical protein
LRPALLLALLLGLLLRLLPSKDRRKQKRGCCERRQESNDLRRMTVRHGVAPPEEKPRPTIRAQQLSLCNQIAATALRLNAHYRLAGFGDAPPGAGGAAVGVAVAGFVRRAK